MALFDKRGGPSLDLEQHVEVGESHATTLCELQRARPGVILTLAGDRGGALGDALARFARAHDCALIELPRKQFGARGPAHSCVFSRLTAPPSSSSPTDDIVGADLVAQCARRGSRLAPNPKDAYLAFAAASAVLQFVEHGGVSRPNHDTTASALSHRFEPFPLHESTRASPGTVVVTCSRSEHFINLDPATARVLEIATPLGPNGEPAREPTRGGQTLSSKPAVGKFLSTHVWAISMTSCFVYRPDIRPRRRRPTRRHELTAPIATRLAGHVRHERRVAAHEGVAASAPTGPRDDRDETRRRGGGTLIFISVRAIGLMTSCFLLSSNSCCLPEPW